MTPELSRTPFCKDFLFYDQNKKLEYEVFHGFGEPNFAVVTGYHGHEYGVIGRLRTMLNRRISTGKLRHSHVRVFYAHPEAVHARTREANGIDINRQFSEPGEMPAYPQAQLLRKMADKFPLLYVFSFHEDNEYPFYFYDIPQHTNDAVMENRAKRLRDGLIEAVKQQGLATYSGPDDLGYQIRDGYVLTPAPENYDNTYETHLVDLGARGLGTVVRSWVFEIPGHETIDQKQQHVSLILDKFVLPFTSETLPIK